MNNDQQYAPILKWKRAEENALKDLTVDEKRHVTPLIQLVPKVQYKIHDGYRETIFVPKETILSDAITKIQHPSFIMKAYLDVSPLFSLDEKEDALNTMSIPTSLLSTINNNVIPVLTIDDLAKLQFNSQLIGFFMQQGICLRIYKEHINDNLWDVIDSLLKGIAISKEKIDIIFDYQVTDSACLAHFLKQIQKDPNLEKWRSIYFASGFFPHDLTSYPNPDTYYLERKDWQLWLDILEKIHKRKPGYSDYTIQYPIYETPKYNPNPSFSLRYANENQWVIMKGQARNAKNNAGDLQYFAHAKTLVDKGLFCGETCCKGDRYVSQLSQNPNQPRGNPATWLQVGINHHMSLTLKQIASLG